jgi:hypothetical protein
VVGGWGGGGVVGGFSPGEVSPWTESLPFPYTNFFLTIDYQGHSLHSKGREGESEVGKETPVAFAKIRGVVKSEVGIEVSPMD